MTGSAPGGQVWRTGSWKAVLFSTHARMGNWNPATQAARYKCRKTSGTFFIKQHFKLSLSIYRRLMTWRPVTRIGHRKRKERGWTTGCPEKSTWQCEEINVATYVVFKMFCFQIFPGHSLPCWPTFHAKERCRKSSFTFIRLVQISFHILEFM